MWSAHLVWYGFRMRFVAAAVVCMLAVASCQLLPSTGISRDRAIQLALEGGTPLEPPIDVVAVREGRLRDLRVNALGEPGPGQDMNQLVWQVELHGIRAVCPPIPGGQCQRLEATTLVYLDHATGEFVFSETGSNAGLPRP